ncbi:MAG: hypothetical protein HY300_10615, partial [Verrucomicrobia bacterium]|nr:hypothetical protein [Verrucomicrobiota bacterium]
MQLSRRRKLLLALAGVVVFVALLIVAERLRGKWALAVCRQRLLDRGEKLNVAELLPPLPAAEDNGAWALEQSAMQLQAALVGTGRTDTPAEIMRLIRPGVARLNTQETDWPQRFRLRGGWTMESNATNATEQFVLRRLAEIRAALEKPALEFGFPLGELPPGYVNSKLGTHNFACQWLSAVAVADLHTGQLDSALSNLIADA